MYNLSIKAISFLIKLFVIPMPNKNQFEIFKGRLGFAGLITILGSIVGERLDFQAIIRVT